MDNRKFQAAAIVTPPAAEVAPSSGYPTDGNPAGGIPATIPGAAWFHQIGEEIRQVITSAGLLPSAADLTQLSQAIQAKIVGNFSGGNQSLSANGYQMLPGGLIIQWGMNLAAPAPGGSTSSFPVAFTDYTTVQLVASYDNPSSSPVVVCGKAISNTQFNLSCSGGATVLGRWIAVAK